MEFNVPSGGSLIHHFQVKPCLPEKGIAQKWEVTLDEGGKTSEVDEFNIHFDAKSTPLQQKAERFIMVFSIDPAVQTAEASWRFLESGVIYCEGKGDNLELIKLELSANGKILTATMQILGEVEESFNFSFVALRQDIKSGECRVITSEDPGGSGGRKD